MVNGIEAVGSQVSIWSQQAESRSVHRHCRGLIQPEDGSSAIHVPHSSKPTKYFNSSSNPLRPFPQSATNTKLALESETRFGFSCVIPLFVILDSHEFYFCESQTNQRKSLSAFSQIRLTWPIEIDEGRLVQRASEAIFTFTNNSSQAETRTTPPMHSDLRVAIRKSCEPQGSISATIMDLSSRVPTLKELSSRLSWLVLAISHANTIQR